MHVFFSVGEPSGDLHASKLVNEWKRRHDGMRCSGFGGPLMQAAGCEIAFRLTDLAIMGIRDVIPLLWRFIALLRMAAKEFDRDRPDAVVLVDYPGFNWWVARIAKRRGIPVIYYLPPQLWAWAPWRIRKVRRFVDLVLCCLPFEFDWYRARGVNARCVGHPFFDEVASRRLDQAFLERQTATNGSDGVVVGILPGSRTHEIELNFGVQLSVMNELRRQIPNVRFLVASFNEGQRRRCEEKLAASRLELPLEFHVGRVSEIIELSQACLMVSGSVSLELLARNTPAVVIYRSGPFHYFLGRMLITCRFISLPNLIAGKPIMPEFVLLGEAQAEVREITTIIRDWLAQRDARESVVSEMHELQRQIASPGATARVVDAIEEHLGAIANTTAARRRAA